MTVNTRSQGNDIAEIKKIVTELNIKMENFESIKTDLAAVTKSVEFLSSKYDHLLSLITESNNENHQLKSKILLLEKSVNIKEKTINDLEAKIVILDQYSRNKNIEIHGIPSADGENCKSIVTKIAKELNINLLDSDVDVAHRLKLNHTNKQMPIIVQFTSRSIRDTFINKKRLTITNKNIANLQIGATIYINENLNSETKSLLWQARNKGRENNYKYIWCRNSKIFVRKADNSPIKVILRKEDLSLIIPETTNGSGVA